MPLNVDDDIQHLTVPELVRLQSEASLPFAVCCLNLNGSLNVGTIIRTAACLGAERAFIFGERRYDRRSTVGAHNYIPVVKVSGFDDNKNLNRETFDAMMNSYGYHPIMIDTGGEKICTLHASAILHSIIQSPNKICLVFGNEGYGIPENIKAGHYVLTIPQIGVLRSLNVSAAAAIVIWEIMRRIQLSQ